MSDDFGEMLTSDMGHQHRPKERQPAATTSATFDETSGKLTDHQRTTLKYLQLFADVFECAAESAKLQRTTRRRASAKDQTLG